MGIIGELLPLRRLRFGNYTAVGPNERPPIQRVAALRAERITPEQLRDLLRLVLCRHYTSSSNLPHQIRLDDSVPIFLLCCDGLHCHISGPHLVHLVRAGVCRHSGARWPSGRTPQHNSGDEYRQRRRDR